MKKGKRSADERARSRLLDYWQRRPEFGEPIGCVATSFTFDAAFFEEQCLSRFIGLESDPDEDERAYRIEREEKLSPTFAAVLIDQRHVPLLRSLRWHVFAARVPREGIFHPKLALLVWHDRIRVLVGSANLTDAGYRRNLETVGALDFSPGGEAPLAVLREVLTFLDGVRGFAAGGDIADGPQRRLHGFLETVHAHVRDWSDQRSARGEPDVKFVGIGPARQNLFEQLRASWAFGPPTLAVVTSPFFDAGDRATVPAGALESLLIQRGEQQVTFCVSGRRMPDRSIELDLPMALATSQRARTTYRHAMVIADDGEEPRSLHAKSLWLQRDDQAIYCIGSSNFTQAGCGLSGTVNVEANLVYVLPSLASDFARVCKHTYPSTELVDLENEVVTFLQREEGVDEMTGFAVLPACFGAATLRMDDRTRTLELQLVGAPPAGFAIALPGGEILLTHAGWEAAGRPVLSTHPCEQPQPPSHLGVMWSHGLELVRAIWSVNVNDTSTLPPPEELRDLSLEGMLEVLTSARPVHETVARLLARRAAAKQRAADVTETDPHKKVDTKHHLLKRMRRAAAAMEELRTRLERPSFSREVLHARLYGPLGPVALAARFVAEEPAGAAFMVAELAATVGFAKLDPRGELTLADARSSMNDVVVALRALAANHPAPSNLRAYVDATFQELGR